MNSFAYSNTNKRYHTLDYFYKTKFHTKVFKISLNAGFSCPNKDGTLSTLGCIYCSKLGSGDFGGDSTNSLEEQFIEVKSRMHKKWPTAKYIAYFQANTNTYAPLKVLKEKYESVLNFENVIGINIATRPDSISRECMDYLSELKEKTYLTVELGLQTIHEQTSNLINRCCSLECFQRCVSELRKRKINVVVHIINGLPYETKEMMIETVKYLNNLDIQGIKIHMLHVIKNTALEELMKNNKIPILSKKEYVEIVCDQLELLRDTIVIHRITGDPNPEELVEPSWLLKKFTVLNEIDKELVARNSYQGKKILVTSQKSNLL